MTARCSCPARCISWIIVKADGTIVAETYSQEIVDALDPTKATAIRPCVYLPSLNRKGV